MMEQMNNIKNTLIELYLMAVWWSSYNLQYYLIINGQVISFGEMVCEGTDFFQLISIIIIMFFKTDHGCISKYNYQCLF